jgi:TonB family protein
MSIPTERWKEWEGRLVDGKFPLQQWIGSSYYSSVFVTERSEGSPSQSVIKLIGAEDVDVNAQLSLWAEAAKLSHPHLIPLFAYGRCKIDDTPMIYVVMEYAEENLAEIIPVRPLSDDETLEMLRPTAQALAFLHGAGFVHSCIRPSNIMAVGNRLKLSSDRLRRLAQGRPTEPRSVYDAPEVVVSGFGPASDIWSLGATLVSVLTQKEPKTDSRDQGRDAALSQVSEPIQGIVRLCLQVEPAKRPAADTILQSLSRAQLGTEPAANASAPAQIRRDQPGRRIVLLLFMLAAVLFAVFIAGKFMGHQSSVPESEARTQNSQPENPGANSAVAPSPRPSPQPGIVQGNALSQIMPEVSQNALHTVTGRIKVGVEVAVDASGKVSSARLKSAGPSQYFSTRALAAARQWKFNPAHVNGQAVASEWILRFQFARTSMQVFPTELKP